MCFERVSDLSVARTTLAALTVWLTSKRCGGRRFASRVRKPVQSFCNVCVCVCVEGSRKSVMCLDCLGVAAGSDIRGHDTPVRRKC